MTDHYLAVDQQLVNVGNGDRVVLPSLLGLSPSYFGLVTVDSTSQSIQIVPNSTDMINGNTGTITYKLSGFYVLLVTIDNSLGWIINPLAITISDLMAALNLSTPFSASDGGTGLSTIPSANYVLGVNNAGTAYEGKNLVEGTNVTITNGPGSITISSTGSGGTVNRYRRSVIYQPWGFDTGIWPVNWVAVGAPNPPLQVRSGGGSMNGVTSNNYVYCEFSAGVNESLNLYGNTDCKSDVVVGNGIQFWQAIVIPVLTNIRVWMAVDDSNSSLDSSDDPGPNYTSIMGFRFSSVAGDTNWMCVTSNGVGDTSTITDSGIPVVANTRYEMMIDCTSGDVEFYIDDALVSTHSTNLPEPETGLSIHDCITTVSGASRNVLYSQAVLQCD